MADQPPDVREALELAGEIDDALEEISERVLSEHADFFESVQAKAADIAAAVEDRGAASDKQLTALRNMLEAVRKWIR